MSNKINYADSNVTYYQVKETDFLNDGFESNIEEFTKYYNTDCLQDVREKLVHMYLLKLDDTIVGYVTLAMAHIRHDATEAIKNKEVNGNIPALLISHLAVHKNFQRRHVGTALLDFIFEIVPNLESLAGCRYVLLNPRDDEGVRNFYTNYGFIYYSNFKGDTESDAFLMDLKFPNIHNSKD